MRATASRAAAAARSRISLSDASPLSNACSTASAANRTTVRMVPSTGRSTAWYAASVARRRPVTRSRAETDSSGAKVSARPRRICERITPELPRAPMSEPWRIASHTSCIPEPSPGSSPTTDSSVRAMFVPVSPSGTGYTLRRLSSSWWLRSTSRYVDTTRRRSDGASACRTPTAGMVSGTLLPFPVPSSCRAVRSGHVRGSERSENGVSLRGVREEAAVRHAPEPLAPAQQAALEPQRPARPRRGQRLAATHPRVHVVPQGRQDPEALEKKPECGSPSGGVRSERSERRRRRANVHEAGIPPSSERGRHAGRGEDVRPADG